MVKRSVTMLMITLIAISLAVASVSLAAQHANILNGTIVSINQDAGKLEIKNESGKIFMLTAGPQTDLTGLREGDHVFVTVNKNHVIQSIVKKG
jgi:hypothetical protein